eukprot:TRINITY_DN6206_c0_g1_i1.p1 TRINITY_DN6206_c0_g1~~TRINITY_DN6206_c0_g1_i1.p1  ORF type:complete len:347 (+),score=76.72 TRINITY_DN6206_c0_g1_i1:63-1043(+)
MGRGLLILTFACAILSTALAGGPTCNQGGAQGRRRFISESFDFNAFAGSWTGDQTISSLDGCADDDRFIVSVVVRDHLWIKFDPAPEAGVTCTKTYIFDAQIGLDANNNTFTVGILQPLPDFWNATAEGTAAFTSGYVHGNITTLDLIDAVDIFNGEYGGEYDIVTNNCAAKIIDVLTFLNFTMDTTFLDWVVAQLNTPKVIELLRNSTSLDQLYPGMAQADILAKPDNELLNKLTYWSANETLAMYGESLSFYRAQALAPKAAPKAAPQSAPKAAPVAGSAPSGGNTKAPVSNAPQGSTKASSSSAVVASISVLFFMASVVYALL